MSGGCNDLDLLRRSAEALRADPAILAVRCSREHILSIEGSVQHLQDRLKRLHEELEETAARWSDAWRSRYEAEHEIAETQIALRIALQQALVNILVTFESDLKKHAPALREQALEALERCPPLPAKTFEWGP